MTDPEYATIDVCAMLISRSRPTVFRLIRRNTDVRVLSERGRTYVNVADLRRAQARTIRGGNRRPNLSP